MALDLYIQKDAILPETDENRFLALEDSGCFWFLHPYFEDISKRTGQMITSYDDAFFKGEDLNLFIEMSGRGRKDILQKPDSWEEFIGTAIHKGEGKEEKLYSTVYKKELESILLKLEKAVNKAQ